MPEKAGVNVTMNKAAESYNGTVIWLACKDVTIFIAEVTISCGMG